MEFNLSERHIMALNVLLVAILAYFAALSIKDVVALRSAMPPAPISRASAASGLGPSNLPRASYQAIVDRDIFNLAPPPAPPTTVVVEDLHLNLVGISQTSKGKPYAIVENAAGEQSVYRVGETIPSAGKLLDVNQDQAIIEHGGKRVAIKLPADESASASESPSSRRFMRAPAVTDDQSSPAQSREAYDAMFMKAPGADSIRP